MKRFSEQLNKKSMTVKLRAAEKRELRERVVSYMEYHPLPAEMKTKKVGRKSAPLTEEYKEVAIPFKLITRWALGAVAIVLIAVPFAAERSVPGDSLYAVKRFNEELRGTLAFDAVQKVEWETERLNRRIAEARLLASEGRLTDEVEAEVAEAVRTHSENAQKNIEVLRGEDADEATLASIAFETTLAVQSAALQEDDEKAELNNSTQPTNPSILATVVEETRAKTNATNASSTIPAFGKIMAKVEQNTTRVYELRDSLIGTASDAQVAEITRRIEDIERSVAEALELRDTDDKTARAILVDSLQRTQKLIVFMTDIEVSQAVDIERLVPVVLTDEEEQAILDRYQSEFNNTMSAIDTALPEVEDAAIVEKSSAILAEIDSLLIEFSTSTEFSTAEAILVSALDLANNVYQLLELDASDTESASEAATIESEMSTSTEDTASTTNEEMATGETGEVEGSETETAPDEETTQPAEGNETLSDSITNTATTSASSTDTNAQSVDT